MHVFLLYKSLLHAAVHLQVFPELYLPVMTENNLRVLKPWRAYIPSFTQLQHRAKVKRLNGYITQLLHKRWATRQSKGGKESAQGYQDVLERIMQALEVGLSLSRHRGMSMTDAC